MIASLYGVKEILILVCSPHSSTWHEHFDYVFKKKRASFFLFSSTSISLDGRLGYFSAFLSPLKRRFHLFGGRPTFGHLFVSRLLVPALFIHFDVRTGGGPLMRFQARRRIP